MDAVLDLFHQLFLVAGEEYRWVKFDVIYYEYGALVMLFDDPTKATRAYNILREASFDDKTLLVIILPNIQVCTAVKCLRY